MKIVKNCPKLMLNMIMSFAGSIHSFGERGGGVRSIALIKLNLGMYHKPPGKRSEAQKTRYIEYQHH
jgi:hypothetical protein